MIRTIFAVILAFLLGTICSFAYVTATSDNAPKRNIPDSGTDLGQEQAYQDMIAAQEAAIAKLSDDNTALTARIDALLAEARQSEAISELESYADEVSEVSPETMEEQPNEAPRRWRGPGGEDLSPEEREEFANRMRGRVVDMWNEEWEQASPQSQERITAISDLQQELMDGRLAMREAETDEERDALRASLEESEAQLRQTLADEQRYRIQELSQKHDLNSPEGIDAFISETRQLMRSPVFNTGGGWGRGGRRGPR